MPKRVKVAKIFLTTIGIIGLFPALLILYVLFSFGGPGPNASTSNLLQALLLLMLLACFGILPLATVWGLSHSKRWAPKIGFIIGLLFVIMGIANLINNFSESNSLTRAMMVTYSFMMIMPGIIITICLRPDLFVKKQNNSDNLKN